MKVRKQVYDLITEDFDFAPIWEFSHDVEGEDGQDEATVRPVSPAISLDAVEVMCARVGSGDQTSTELFR